MKVCINIWLCFGQQAGHPAC